MLQEFFDLICSEGSDTTKFNCYIIMFFGNTNTPAKLADKLGHGFGLWINTVWLDNFSNNKINELNRSADCRVTMGHSIRRFKMHELPKVRVAVFEL